MKPPRFVRSLAAKERRQIEELFRRGPNARIRRRAQAVRLSAMGYPAAQIVEIIGCSRQTVHNSFNAFEAGGCDALFDSPRSGRPAIATVDYRWRLVQAVKANPRDLSYPFTVWTVTRLRAHMAKEMNILLSESRVRQIMKEEGLVFKRPKHTLAGKRDEDAFAEMRDILNRAKKGHWNPVPA